MSGTPIDLGTTGETVLDVWMGPRRSALDIGSNSSNIKVKELQNFETSTTAYQHTRRNMSKNLNKLGNRSQKYYMSITN